MLMLILCSSNPHIESSLSFCFQLIIIKSFHLFYAKICEVTSGDYLYLNFERIGFDLQLIITFITELLVG